ncbi:hypothetical protein BJX66DRAFT_305192 [Aspergillus keveii]|uniref:Uncharacterized protein n=1 Tax=Aspergillus keveii TaxID=714993 RepID=A0ABR4G461_9EURO
MKNSLRYSFTMVRRGVTNRVFTGISPHATCLSSLLSCLYTGISASPLGLFQMFADRRHRINAKYVKASDYTP